MKEQILKLREERKTYDEIKEILGCSKGTISYHCGEGQKEKTTNRTRKFRGDLRGAILKKVYAFRYGKRQGKSNISMNQNCDVFYKEAVEKIINSPYCYLTGRKIDLEDTKSYQLDHIIPFSKGGSNDLKNMGLTCRDANRSKIDLSLDEYISLCEEVLNNLKNKRDI